MRVLIDQNISHRLASRIAFLFEEVTHIRTKGWTDWNDHAIFMTARHEQYQAVITLDEDFYKLLYRHGAPPKVVWLKTGNCSTSKLIEIIIAHQEVIKSFIENPIAECLEIYG